MLEHVQKGTWPSGRERHYIQCRVPDCRKSQTVDPTRTASFPLAIGWAQVEDGWVCPFHSDAGPAAILAIGQKANQ